MKYKLFILILTMSFLIANALSAQVGINSDNSNPDPSAMLDISSTDKGILVPRMISAQRTSINNPALGLLVFDTDTESFWFHQTNGWQELVNDLTSTISDKDNDTKIEVEEGPDEDRIRFDVGGSEAIVIDTNGNVGISTAVPKAKLEVQAAADTFGILISKTAPENTVGLYFNYGNNPGAVAGIQSDRDFGGVDNGGLQLLVANDRPIQFYVKANSSSPKLFETEEVMRIHGDGNVGIGTNNPTAKLHVMGGIKMTDGNEAQGKIMMSDFNGLANWVDPIDLTVPDTTQLIPIRYHGSYRYVHPTDSATNTDWTNAKTTCENLDAFGFKDWYLPSKLELDAMYKQSFLITGLSQTATVKYWSLTELDASNAYTQRLDYGGPDPDAKTDSTGHHCRCIRKN